MKAVKFFLKVFSFIGVFLIFFLVTIYLSGLIICYGPSRHARDLFITTFLETGQLKFVANLFMSKDKIREIVDKNKMEDFDAEIDDTLIKSDTISNLDLNLIDLIEIKGGTYFAKMMIVNDPSRIKLATIYDDGWKNYGLTLDKLVKKSDAIAGVNGGLYESYKNQGGRPRGLIVREGNIEFNSPVVGMHLIGMDKNNLLRIIDLSEKNSSEVEEIIKKENIRDAVAFQEEASDSNNHFVKLIINGQARNVNGNGSGANPRTAIGQRSDGAILLLVTDGRGANGHLGATANDLIKIMKKYGAVNAANIDGGSSSSMYYNGKYEMTSVTLYYSNSSWRLPDAFVVEKR